MFSCQLVMPLPISNSQLEYEHHISHLLHFIAKYTFTHLAGHDGGKIFLLVHQHKVLKGTRLEKECVSLLQRHGRRKLRFVVIITQVGNLIQVANKQNILDSDFQRIMCPTVQINEKLQVKHRFCVTETTAPTFHPLFIRFTFHPLFICKLVIAQKLGENTTKLEVFSYY